MPTIHTFMYHRHTLARVRKGELEKTNALLKYWSYLFMSYMGPVYVEKYKQTK